MIFRPLTTRFTGLNLSESPASRACCVCRQTAWPVNNAAMQRSRRRRPGRPGPSLTRMPMTTLAGAVLEAWRRVQLPTHTTAPSKPARAGTRRPGTVSDRTDRGKTARDKTARVKTARVKTARVKTARDKTARDKTARDKTARDKTARDKTARDKTARDKTALVKTARAKMARDKTACGTSERAVFGWCVVVEGPGTSVTGGRGVQAGSGTAGVVVQVGAGTGPDSRGSLVPNGLR